MPKSVAEGGLQNNRNVCKQTTQSFDRPQLLGDFGTAMQFSFGLFHLGQAQTADSLLQQQMVSPTDKRLKLVCGACIHIL